MENRAIVLTDRLGLHPTGDEGIWYASGGSPSGGNPSGGSPPKRCGFRIVIQTFIPYRWVNYPFNGLIPGPDFRGDGRGWDTTPDVADDDYRTRIDIRSTNGQVTWSSDAGITVMGSRLSGAESQFEAKEGEEMHHSVNGYVRPGGMHVDVRCSAKNPH